MAYSFFNYGRLVCMRKHLGFRNCTQAPVMEEIDFLPGVWIECLGV